jgi:hypothetical protein
VSALAGVAAAAEPTGLDIVDDVWSGLLAGAGALIGSYARRGPLLVAACFAALLAPDGWSLLPAAIAIVFAAASTADLARPTPFLRGISAGAAITSQLAASNQDRAVVFVVAGWLLVAGPILLSGLRRAPEPIRNRMISAGFVFGCIVVLAAAAAAIGTAAARADVDRGVTALRAGMAATRDGDLEEAQAQLTAASESLDSAASTIRLWGFAGQAVPGASQNVRALHAVLDDVHEAATRASEVAGVTDVEALSPNGGFLDLSLVEALLTPMVRLTASLDIASEGIEALAQEPLLPPIRDRLDDLTPELDRALEEARTGSNAALVVPHMLGRAEPVRYLVLFTSPTEARGRFGFPAVYGTITVDNGTFDLELAESIGNLQEGDAVAVQSEMPVGDELVGPYIDYGATRNWRSVTVPPDFPTVGTLARELWSQTGTGEIHGVLRVDTTALAAFVEITGPVTVTGRAEPLAAEDVTRYLDFEQYVQFGDEGAEERQEALEELARTVFDRLLEVDMPGPRALADLFGPLTDQGRLQLITFDEVSMRFLDSIGITGRFEPPSTPDAIALGAVNLAGNKIDAFLERQLDYRATVADDGTVQATLTMTLYNSAPSSGLPAYVIGSALDTGAPPPGTNRTTQLVWSVLGVAGVEIDGEPVSVSSNPTGGWWVHGVTLDIPPGATRVVTLSLAGAPAESGRYRLQLIPGDPVVADEVTVTVERGGEVGEPREITLREPTRIGS